MYSCNICWWSATESTDEHHRSFRLSSLHQSKFESGHLCRALRSLQTLSKAEDEQDFAQYGNAANYYTGLDVRGGSVRHFSVFRLLVSTVLDHDLVIRPRRCRSVAAYSRQTFPWTICRSVGPYVQCKYVRTCVRRSVCRSVCLSSALWKNGGSDPDSVWHHRSDGPGMRKVVLFGIGPREGVLWGRIWGAPL